MARPDREICEPLTVRDAFSRKALAVTLVPSRHTVHVRRALERLFRRHGVPLAMQCDNGSWTTWSQVTSRVVKVH